MGFQESIAVANDRIGCLSAWDHLIVGCPCLALGCYQHNLHIRAAAFVQAVALVMFQLCSQHAWPCLGSLSWDRVICVSALQVLSEALELAALNYGKADHSRIYSFLMEDQLLNQLKGCVHTVTSAISEQFSTTLGLPDDLHGACESLRQLTCNLPDHQIKLIVQFRKLVRS